MLRQNNYPSHDDMIQIDWHHAGVFNNSAGSARSAYLGASSAPDTYFDGIDNVLGAGDSVGTYNTYRNIVNNHYNNQLSQLIIRDAYFSLDLNAMIGTVTCTVEVAPGETILTPADVILRSAAYEDDLTWCCEPQTTNSFWNHIGRALGTTTTLVADNSGETQVYTSTFALDSGWNPNNLSVAVFAQRNTLPRKVLQAGEACRSYAVSVETLGGTVVSSAVPVDFDAEVTYGGCLDDDVTVTLDKSGLPGDWDAEIVVGASTYPNTVTFPGMTLDQVQPYAIRVTPGASAALAFVSVTTEPATSPGTGATVDYGVFANTPAILYVNDDNGGASQSLYEAAIANTGNFYYTHDVDTLGDPDFGLLAGFDAVIWNTGQLQGNTIGLPTQAALMSYLDGGGKLFLSSQGLLNQYGAAPVFIKDYLRVSAYSQDWQARASTGVPGDPIGDGLSFTVANVPFPDFADDIVANTGGVVWLVGYHGDVALHYDSGTFKTVFMTPALELVPAPNETTIMTRVLNWFFPGGAVDAPTVAEVEPTRLALRQNAPNPFSSETSVSFSVPKAGVVNLDVFDVTGRRVTRLVDGPLPAGPHSARWDGRDSGGSRVASGVYLLRLSAGGESVSKDVVLTR